MNEPDVRSTEIPGLLVVSSSLQETPDGWFTENWHDAKLESAGGPSFNPVQHNVTLVQRRGVTRGFHAEPWDRYVSVLSGSAFGAWVDLREGEGYGRVATQELSLGTSVFVPRGVGNAHQVLEDGTTFSYLLSEHWTPEARERTKTANLFDPALQIPWPISRDYSVLSERDLAAPYLSMPKAKSTGLGSMFRRSAVHIGRGDERGAGPYRVLFVCTANICRSAYADVVARASRARGIEFASAGTHALVGEPIDPPMGGLTAGRGEARSHRAQQLDRGLVDEADLILTMAPEHRRYILDEWPQAATKTFVIGHAAREIQSLPAGSRLGDVTKHLWQHRSTGQRDAVSDPYRRGQAAAITAAQAIDTHLESIIPALQTLVDRQG
ncbi:hypothetical protein EJO69_02195 [Flaviflexus salsibiostraticola]|uniref:Phosphotyrosine protein phosphatase I domain-containing protein n=1 Tax=Flaviflexus salsibiostraticola TaxID=1282737 RepID=A0A3S8Z6W7_9ACTO|nr:dTDP-4-dehydrorhamnose 3,5-epimerase family protein [Flaviflexus salsibiostraticola]AZN29239.1 hypothetical protein EJO69_02195 [Flaviflexus salsibiostraticola]